MHIRAYRPEDFAALTTLWDACGLSVSGNDPAREIPLMAKAPDCQLYVGYESGRLIASMMVGHEGHRGWIYKLAIDPGHQRRGLGRELVRLAERWLVARGLPKCQVIIRDHNRMAQGFYERLGYGMQPRLFLGKPLSADTVDMRQAEIDVVTTYLEMTERPKRAPTPTPVGSFALMRMERPPVAFYRYLYNMVGEPWFWADRRRMSDPELVAEIQAEGVDIFVLYSGGVPAGFAEIDRRRLPLVNIAYVGLVPDCIGKGLGRYLLNWAVDHSWTFATNRVTVDTCTLDHPRALGAYQRAGFRPYRQSRQRIIDPRLEGLIPAHLEPRVPVIVPAEIAR